jgi:single-strand DNA-binding protein
MVVNFSIATSRRWKDANGEQKEQTEFHNVVVFGKLAEICAQYLKKGSKVYVDGRLQTRSWEGEDGVKRYRTETILENMIMLDKKGQTSGGSYDRAPSGIAQAAPADDVPTVAEGGAMPQKEVAVEDLPF